MFDGGCPGRGAGSLQWWRHDLEAMRSRGLGGWQALNDGCEAMSARCVTQVIFGEERHVLASAGNPSPLRCLHPRRVSKTGSGVSDVLPEACVEGHYHSRVDDRADAAHRYLCQFPSQWSSSLRLSLKRVKVATVDTDALVRAHGVDT